MGRVTAESRLIDEIATTQQTPLATEGYSTGGARKKGRDRKAPLLGVVDRLSAVHDLELGRVGGLAESLDTSTAPLLFGRPMEAAGPSHLHSQEESEETHLQ